MQRKSFDSMPCPIARSLERVGEWWSMLILRDALHGMTRFDEFQKSLGIAPNMLTRRLQALVEAVRGESLDAARIHARGLAWEAAHAQTRAALQVQAETGRRQRPLEKAWVSACVDQVRNDSTLIINELGLEQDDARAGQHEIIEIEHLSAFPQECASTEAALPG